MEFFILFFTGTHCYPWLGQENPRVTVASMGKISWVRWVGNEKHHPRQATCGSPWVCREKRNPLMSFRGNPMSTPYPPQAIDHGPLKLQQQLFTRIRDP